MIFDTHAHYDDHAFDEDRDEILSQMEANGIKRIVNVGASMKSSRTTFELAQKYPFIYAAVGVHPEDAADITEESLKELKEMTKNSKVVAIGEIGLDYHWPEPEPALQKEVFIRQLELAKELQLPVIIHSRDAAKETLDILRLFAGSLPGGVMHCFSYSKEIAQEIVKMGFEIGIGGVSTFSNARKTVEVIEAIPMEHIILETDCPYLAPVPNRGKRNSSLYLPLVVDKIAEIKGITPEEVERITWENGNRMYRLDK